MQPYYQEALATNAQTLRTACLRLESRVSALASMAQQTAPWEALFTDTDVNGWLAVALEEKFPGWLPETISDLRVAFTDPWLLVGFHYQDAHYDTVVTLRMVPYVVEADGLARLFVKRRFGLDEAGLPAPQPLHDALRPIEQPQGQALLLLR